MRKLKGWYDEQWTAIADAAGTRRPLMYAAVFPALDIASHPASGYGSAQFVAIVTLRHDPPANSKYFR